MKGSLTLLGGACPTQARQAGSRLGCPTEDYTCDLGGLLSLSVLSPTKVNNSISVKGPLQSSNDDVYTPSANTACCIADAP